MKTLIVFLITATASFAQPGAADPFPLETRVKNLEDRVAALEKNAMTIGVKANQYSSYEELRTAVKNGAYATLAIGVSDPAELHVPSGFMSLSDGVYSLFPGEPMMVKRFGTSALGAQTQVPVFQNTTVPDISTKTVTCVNGVCTTESASTSTRIKLFPNAPWNR